tara:strand:- start:44 stop:643 length:600 start_codon:yes stop_codon:yes gene_type:complete
MRISNGSGKLQDIRSLNTNTLTNEFCKAMYNSSADDIICRKCYSMNMLNGLRKNCAPSWQENSDILSGGLIPPHMLPTILDAFFRFSSHGELINMTMLENFHNITLHNPHCSFALWTKRKNFIRKFYSQHEKPANLILIYSNPRIDAVMDTPPEFFDRTFNNVSKGSDVAQNCTGQKCRDCLLCYKAGNGVTQIVEAVK